MPFGAPFVFAPGAGTGFCAIGLRTGLRGRNGSAALRRRTKPGGAPAFGVGVCPFDNAEGESLMMTNGEVLAGLQIGNVAQLLHASSPA